ncbi:Arabinanolytic transcriptional activator araR [Exophiala dermatitidis]
MGIKKTGRRRTPASAPCPKCGRSFARNDSLNRHLKTHSDHVEHRPFHRIIHDKFRACNRCRRAKIRCTGSLPCARCAHLKQDCDYGQKSPDPSAVPTTSSDEAGPGTAPRAAAASGSPTSPSPDNEPADTTLSSADGGLLENFKPPTKATLEATDARLDVGVSSPDGAAALLQLSLGSDLDSRTVLFDEGKDFSVSNLNSTYVSPTLHVLDPYSYKLPSIADSREAPTPTSQPLAHCRYGILRYLSPFMMDTDTNLGSNLACDLLDTYFSSAFSSRMHPTCHHIHNFILRRCDILDPAQPRKTHPGLLASMLFVAALSDKALGLFSGPEERDRVCKYLSLLTYRLLNPARYEPLLSREDLGLPPDTIGSDPGWTNENLRQALNPQQQDLNTFPITWGTDYIIALIHVSSVISGSEKKAASIRWWNVAFNLARDLKLNQEVESHHHLDSELAVQVGELNCKCSLGYEGNDDVMTEVHREERRRTWWLLFLMDRHLALCYNRPLALLEAECKDLLLPLDDVTWQSGAQPHSHGTRADGPRCVLLPSGTGRLHGPPTVCSGVGLFEFFLPLMTITGHLLDYNRAKNNPVLASAGSSMWTSQEQRILRELDHYQATLDHQTTQPKHGDSGSNKSSSPWMTMTSPAAAAAAIPTVALETAMDESETTHIARTVSGYATHVVCVLRILVGSKWDPVCLFEDADFWTSSLGFKDSMSHTMAASECVTHILQHDPDVSFMPYFFGIQLLHGSLLLLLVAYRLQGDSGTAILAACEAVIRATEACFVTLPTDYQRQFRNVMRSAIALAKGRRNNPVDTEKQLTFVLARYRWSRNGAGLAR